MSISKDEYKKAVSRLEEAISQKKNDFIRDSVIQRFEFSVELAWKTCKKVMGSSSVAPKDIIREMAQSGYIDNPEEWILAIDMRNLSSHTYKEELAEKVYNFACNFITDLKALLVILESK
ncbi:MAG: nucleotidyltransferase substrate binding protein [Bdellovibrionales bacterium]|nr:nucleotidyltransferase substrate binding protein [Bdellovibrionales bacterium]